MTEVQFNTEVNLLNLINPKPRFVNFYVKGGVGYTFYNATKSDFKTNIVANTAKGGVFVVPWGFGGRLDFNERWGFYGETTFNHAFGDELDAHDSKWTDVNDIYTYTSFGFTYKIYARDKKPVIEEIDIVDPMDTTVAEASLAPINIKVKVPRTVEPGASFTMKIQIDKDLRNEAAKLQQTLPLGFSATERVSEGGSFQFKDQISNISWTSLPKTPETLFIEYGVKVADDVEEKTYVIPGILFYTENGEERMHQFKLELKVERPVVAEEKPETNDEGSQSNNADIKTTEPETNSASNNDNGIVFRVQVKAIYGGKSSPELIRKKYGLDTEVHEDYHNGYMKYSTGNYGSYQDAALLKQQLREKRNQWSLCSCV